jgi:2-hydroxymuconate-semialdehyde hydrolase
VADPAVFGEQLDKIAAQRIPRATRPEVERSHRATLSLVGDPLPISTEGLEAITNPVLLIHGDTDRIIPLEASTWHAKHLPNARLEVIANAGRRSSRTRHSRYGHTPGAVAVD